jgi:hypothetical protein
VLGHEACAAEGVGVEVLGEDRRNAIGRYEEF